MKPLKRNNRSDQGSVILITMCTAFVLSLVVAAILDFSVFSYRSSLKKIRYEQAKLAASNEMEYMFNQWATQVTVPSGTPVETQLSSNRVVFANPTDIASSDDHIWDITTAWTDHNTPFLNDFGGTVPVTSSIQFGRSLQGIDLHAIGSVANASGTMQTGNVKYWLARTRVRIVDPVLGATEVRIGRRFTLETVSSLSFAVYYQGDMEFGTSQALDIRGDIECNGNLYAGAQSRAGSELNLYGRAYFAGLLDGASGSQYSLNPTGSYKDASWVNGGRDSQAIQMKAQDNLLGLNDPSDPSTYISNLLHDYPTAYPTENEIYRALVAPPPRDAGGALIAESDHIQEKRLYNLAGLIITVDGSSGTDVYTAVDPRTNTDYTTYLSSALTSVRKDVWDAREQKTVKMTTLDVGALGTAINNIHTDNPDYLFNGILYIYDKTTMDSSHLNGIRITSSGASSGQTPGFDYSSTDPAANSKASGFTIATEDGLYIQGDYNTAKDKSGNINNAAVMADSVTVLSAGWKDENSTLSDYAANRVASANITVNAGIMSGNVKTVMSGTDFAVDANGYQIKSGGTQNLVRYLEDWSGKTTEIKGSLVQLFNSKYFNTPFRNPGETNAYYGPPALRKLEFDTALASNPPNGTPATKIDFYRGDLFTW